MLLTLTTTRLRKLKVSTLLAVGFGTTVAFGASIAAYSAIVMSRMSAAVDEVANESMGTVARLTELQESFNSQARFSRNFILSDDP